MTGGITAVRNTLLPDYQGPRLPREVQRKRLQNVIDNELTPRQRQILLAYYFQNQNQAQIARELGVHRSTVNRTLQRAEKRVRRCLKY